MLVILILQVSATLSYNSDESLKQLNVLLYSLKINDPECLPEISTHVDSIQPKNATNALNSFYPTVKKDLSTNFHVGLTRTPLSVILTDITDLELLFGIRHPNSDCHQYTELLLKYTISEYKERQQTNLANAASPQIKRLIQAILDYDLYFSIKQTVLVHWLDHFFQSYKNDNADCLVAVFLFLDSANRTWLHHISLESQSKEWHLNCKQDLIKFTLNHPFTHWDQPVLEILHSIYDFLLHPTIATTTNKRKNITPLQPAVKKVVEVDEEYMQPSHKRPRNKQGQFKKQQQ